MTDHWFESFRRLYTINTYALIPNNGSVIGIMHMSYTRNEYDAQTCILCDVVLFSTDTEFVWYGGKD